jgi:hypothetical protein
VLHAAQNVQAAGAGAEQSQATAATLRPLGVGPNRSASMPALDKINLSTASSGDDGAAGGGPGGGQQQQVRRRRQRLDTMSSRFAGWGAERVKAWVETQLRGSAHTHQGAVIGAAGEETFFSPLFILKLTILPRQARDKYRENSKKDTFIYINAVMREGVDGVMLQKLTTPAGWEELGATALVAAKLAANARALTDFGEAEPEPEPEEQAVVLEEGNEPAEPEPEPELESTK